MCFFRNSKVHKNMKDMKYLKPNFQNEWQNAEKMPEFHGMEKKEWADFAAQGYQVKLNEVINSIQNMDFCDICPKKRAIVQNQIANGELEIPVLAKLDEEKYEVISGKTRICELLKKNLNPPVWIVDLSSLMFLVRPV